MGVESKFLLNLASMFPKFGMIWQGIDNEVSTLPFTGRVCDHVPTMW